MFKLVLLAALATVAMSQIIGNRVTFATAHGYRFEYDDRHNVVLVVGEHDCYLIDATDAAWDDLIHNDDRAARDRLAESIYQAIQAGGSAVTAMSQQEAADYHSRLEQLQCRNDTLHHLAYTPPSN